MTFDDEVNLRVVRAKMLGWKEVRVQYWREWAEEVRGRTVSVSFAASVISEQQFLRSWDMRLGEE